MIKYDTQDHYHKKAIRPVCGVLIALDGILVWLERKFCYCMSYLRANRTDMECAIFLVNLDSHDQLVSSMRDNYAGGAKQMMGQMLLRYKFLKPIKAYGFQFLRIENNRVLHFATNVSI